MTPGVCSSAGRNLVSPGGGSSSSSINIQNKRPGGRNFPPTAAHHGAVGKRLRGSTLLRWAVSLLWMWISRPSWIQSPHLLCLLSQFTAVLSIIQPLKYHSQLFDLVHWSQKSSHCWNKYLSMNNTADSYRLHSVESFGRQLLVSHTLLFVLLFLLFYF